MSTRALVFGREAIYTVEGGVGCWRYPDGVLAATTDPEDGSTFHYAPTVLPCPKCALRPLPGGEDPCLGVLPDVTTACCGHGVVPGWQGVATLIPRVASDEQPGLS